MDFVRLLFLSGLGLPFLLINDGGRMAWMGALLLAGEAVIAIVIGRKVVKKHHQRSVQKKVLPPFIFLAVYFLGNVLATLIVLRIARV